MREKFFLKLLEVSSLHGAQSRSGFQQLGLSEGQPKVLYILVDGEGIVQKKLAQLCNIKPSTLTVILDKLEMKGYIYREKIINSEGKRTFGVFLTDMGRATAKEVCRVVDELEEETMNGMTEEERDLFMNYMGKICCNLRRSSEK